MKKKKIIHIAIFTLLEVVVLSFLFYEMSKLSYSRESRFTEVTSEYKNYCFEIESFDINQNKVRIKGWCFCLGLEASKHENLKRNTKPVFLLVDSKDDKNKLVIRSEWNKREDVNKYFSCDIDYSYCGLSGEINASKINIRDTKYKLLIKYDRDSEHAIDTGCFIINGKLEYGEKNTDLLRRTEGTELNEIVKNGEQKLSLPDRGIYVYQLNEFLYWIADEKFVFNDDKTIMVQYLIFSNQKERLPNGSKSFAEDKCSDFTAYEITNLMDSGSFRVYKREIPNEYAITCIETGVWEKKLGWEWQGYFRPTYRLFQENREKQIEGI